MYHFRRLFCCCGWCFCQVLWFIIAAVVFSFVGRCLVSLRCRLLTGFGLSEQRGGCMIYGKHCCFGFNSCRRASVLVDAVFFFRRRPSGGSAAAWKKIERERALVSTMYSSTSSGFVTRSTLPRNSLPRKICCGAGIYSAWSGKVRSLFFLRACASACVYVRLFAVDRAKQMELFDRWQVVRPMGTRQCTREG